MLQSIALCKVFLLNFCACGWFLTVFKWKLLSSYFLQYNNNAPRGEGYSWKFLVGVSRLVLLTLTLPDPDPISDQKKSFFTPVLRPGPVFRPGLEEIMSSLLRTATITNFKIHFDFVCFSFFLTHMEFLRSRRSLENHTRFQTKTDKVYTHFQTKTAKKPYPLGRHTPTWLI